MKLYCQNTDSGLTEPQPLPMSHPYISGFHLLDDTALADLGWYRFEDAPSPSCDPDSERAVAGIEHDGGVARRTWTVAPAFVSTDEHAAAVAEKRATIRAEADRVAKEKRDQVTADISPAEMASWPIKRAEALAYQSGDYSAATNLEVEAQARGIALADLVDKVLAKATQLSALEAAIAGRCGAIQDAAEACQALTALGLIDVDAGWPV